MATGPVPEGRTPSWQNLLAATHASQRSVWLPRSWKVPILMLSLSAVPSALAGTLCAEDGDAPTQLPMFDQKLFEKAEKLLGRGPLRLDNPDLISAENRELLESAVELSPGTDRTDSLRNLTRILSGQDDFPKAREAALNIDDDQLVEKVRTMVDLATAERLADRPDAAWWTLHEAQKHALKIRNAEQLIGVMRDIGDLERQLRTAAEEARDAEKLAGGGSKADGAVPIPRLDPDPTETIQKVLSDGLPEVGYHEIEVLQDGGGPHRSPRVISHTYYYNGDRTFQGPFFPGGPTDVQVTHPRSGHNCSLRINMPTGTPFIEYSSHSIEYYFPEVVVEVNFRRSGGYDVDYRRLFNRYKYERARVLKPRVGLTGCSLCEARIMRRFLRCGG
jgi:hypothetical protein